uniref:Uncharacterized protein n=1 Tax=Chlamydomonas leiostraca TaxID=1034604 RepID=A0A7S0R532_9CHLO|mmetsp:Transcript_14121/g.34816  ORF Transcript_14121/g.34816 Transcript_14121/m.34816 type:complete len:925 (+) Transcript_14121:119-2893(+)
MLRVVCTRRGTGRALLQQWHTLCQASGRCNSTSSTQTLETTRQALKSAGLDSVLVANRGEIACRVMATARKLGLRTVAVFSEADRGAAHVQAADEAYCIGPAAARDSYLRQDVLLRVAGQARAKAIHPGYGFLSENAGFADACKQAGVVFVGPPGSAIRSMGDKAAAKAIMTAAGVPVVPGYHGEDQSEARLLEEAEKIGFPLLVKAVSGGGGKGMKLAHSMEELPAALASARREAAAAFGDDRVLLERYITRPRHVEVQVVADAHGRAVYVFDRDCSLQRRHQKVIEEAPAPGLPAAFHTHIGEAAVRAALATGYTNAGTVEFIVDMGSAEAVKPFYFMEMNTRLQVEHPVSELVAGVDLVEWQLAVAAGARLPLTQEQVLGARGARGHAFEARLYAEAPRNNFLPGAGTVRRWRPPPAVSFELPPAVLAANAPAAAGSAATAPVSSAAAAAGGGATAVPGLPPGTCIRVDSGVREGDEVGINYDPMIAKLITWGPDRDSALAALRAALSATQVAGLPTNLAYLHRLASHNAFSTPRCGSELDTGFIPRHASMLLHPQPLPPSVAALAGVARWLLQAAADGQGMAGGAALVPPQGAAPQGAGHPLPAPGASVWAPGGPWGLGDAKRLWHHATFRFADMALPEGGVQSAAAVAAAAKEAHGHSHHGHGHSKEVTVAGSSSGSGSSGGGGLDVGITVVSQCDFEVEVAGANDDHVAPLGSSPSGTSVKSGSADATSGNSPGRPRFSIRNVKLLPDGAAVAAGAAGGRAVAGQTGGRVEAEVEGARVRADVLTFTTAGGNEGVLCMWTGGAAYEFRWPIPRWSRDMGAAASVAGAGGAVTAPMPGRVVKVAVAEGDKVAKGAPLVVLEAMKMEHSVVAPRAGVVRQLAVAAGTQVSDSHVLMVVMAEEAAAAAAAAGGDSKGKGPK